MKVKYSNMMQCVQLTVPDHGLGLESLDFGVKGMKIKYSNMMQCVQLTEPDHGLGLDPGVNG